MLFKVEKKVTNIKLELTEEEFNTLYTAMNITSAEDIVEKKHDSIKVLDSLGQRELFAQMKKIYKSI